MISSVRRHASFANVVSLTALFVALGGTAVAVKVKLKTNQVKTKNLAASAVTGPKIAANAVTGPKIADNAVTKPKIAANAVDGGKIDDGSIGIGDVNNSLHQNCPAGTSYLQGACLDNAIRAASATYGVASVACQTAGGRLPTAAELVTFVIQRGGAITIVDEWALDVNGAASDNAEFVSLAGNVGSHAVASMDDYRCAFDPLG